VIDVAILLVIAIVTYCVASEGAYGAGWVFLIVLFSGLLTMNLYEPLAGLFQSMFGAGTPTGQARCDFVSFLLLFTGLVFGFRLLVEKFCPEFLTVNDLAFEICRWGFGFLTGYVTAAILLTALHTAAMPREFAGFTPERKNLFGLVAPDRQWLGFTQYVSERNLGRGRVFDGPEFTRGPATKPIPTKIWPSFPIRHAQRRETIATGTAPAPLEGVRPGESDGEGKSEETGNTTPPRGTSGGGSRPAVGDGF